MRNKLICAIIIFLISGCGFKVVKQSDFINFNIKSISTSGDNRVSYIVKNKLLPYSKKNGGKKLISLEIDLNKNKFIKEKNIKNEITKYKIKIIANVSYQITPIQKKGNFSISNSGSYDVNKKYSQTIKNEKNLVSSLTESLASEIKNNLINIADDF